MEPVYYADDLAKAERYAAEMLRSEEVQETRVVDQEIARR
jgi:hypothetical protein